MFVPALYITSPIYVVLCIREKHLLQLTVILYIIWLDTLHNLATMLIKNVHAMERMRTTGRSVCLLNN